MVIGDANGEAVLRAILEKVATDPWESGPRGYEGELFTAEQVEWARQQISAQRVSADSAIAKTHEALNDLAALFWRDQPDLFRGAVAVLRENHERYGLPLTASFVVGMRGGFEDVLAEKAREEKST